MNGSSLRCQLFLNNLKASNIGKGRERSSPKTSQEKLTTCTKAGDWKILCPQQWGTDLSLPCVAHPSFCLLFCSLCVTMVIPHHLSRRLRDLGQPTASVLKVKRLSEVKLTFNELFTNLSIFHLTHLTFTSIPGIAAQLTLFCHQLEAHTQKLVFQIPLARSSGVSCWNSFSSQLTVR